MGTEHCRWARDRLPLLAGGELVGGERRRVERHLIVCPACRRQSEAARGALAVLHVAAAEPPSRREAPSLWPDLERQIREMRRPAAPSWGLWPRFATWAAAGLAAGLLLAVAWSRLAPNPGPAVPVHAPIIAQVRQQAPPKPKPAPPKDVEAEVRLATTKESSAQAESGPSSRLETESAPAETREAALLIPAR
jgi:hypothetical protein